MTHEAALASAATRVLSQPGLVEAAIHRMQHPSEEARAASVSLLREVLVALRDGVDIPSEQSGVSNILRDWAHAHDLSELMSLAERVSTGLRVLCRTPVFVASSQGASLDDLRDAVNDTATRLMALAAMTQQRVDGETSSVAHDRLRLALHALLSGLPPADAAPAMRRLSLDPEAAYWVWNVKPQAPGEDRMQEALDAAPRPPDGLFTTFGGRLVGLSRTRSPFAVREMDGGVAGPVGHSNLAEAFDRSYTAWLTGNTFAVRGIHAMEDLGLLPQVLANPAAGEALLIRYVEPLAGAGQLGSDILATVHAYLAHHHQRRVVSEVMHVHVNTVTYRLRRFAEITGAAIDDLRTQAELWWLFTYLSIRDARPDKSRRPGQEDRLPGSVKAVDALLGDFLQRCPAGVVWAPQR